MNKENKNTVIDFFNTNADQLARQYNTIDRTRVHADLLSLLPQDQSLNILDIGAGSGADAAMFSMMGHMVTACEPANSLRLIGQNTFGHHADINWNANCLPQMGTEAHSAAPFDVVTSVGVLQYLDQDERKLALRKMFSLVADDGLLQIQYPTPASREGQHTIKPGEIEKVLSEFGDSMQVIVDNYLPDFTGRKALNGADLYFRTLIVHRHPE